MNLKRNATKSKLISKKTLFTEIRQEFIQEQQYINKTFNISEYISKQECSSITFGHTQIDQKCYICTKCDRKGQHFICNFCYEHCHNKCRPISEDKLQFLLEKEFLNYKRFACYCGLNLKHILEVGQKLRKSNCNMMKLDQNLGIGPYECLTHNLIICCICAVACHEKCNKNYIIEIDDELTCECDTDYHSNFNEFALSFPLEKYKSVANVDIWPIQILNILFSTRTTFNKLVQFFHRTLSNELDFKNINNNIALINKFENLLELFSDSFNRKFKTYYYHNEMSKMFPFNNLFNMIKKLEVINGQTAIIRFRLLFILLFLHLRKDFNNIKSLTSNDFYCNTVLERLKFKKVLKSDKIFSYEINEKYNLNSEVKKFVLISICDLITKGMNYVSIEENQDEFEIGLKLIAFMLKRMIFDKNDLILLINSIYDFHSNFYKYIMSEANNIYSLIDIFNCIIEICYLISVYYNDLIIEEYLDNANINQEFNLNDVNDIGKFIHSKSEHSIKLLTILLKNCDLFTKHYHILIKPNLDKKNKEEIKRENILRRHKIAMQNQITNRTTGVKTKMPENGGLFTDKIINLFIENLSLFSLADNLYQKKLNFITNENITNYYKFCQNVKNEEFYEIMNIEQGKHHSNILYNLKSVIDEIYFDLFTTSYLKQKNTLDQKLRSSLLNAIDQIHINIKLFKKKPEFINLINNLKQSEKKLKKNQKSSKNFTNIILDELETFKRKILKEITSTIKFAKSKFLLIQKGRELLIDNLIISQIDEILFKGMFFLSDTHYPNIITPELYDLFFKFLSLFLITKNGTIYIITGKNLQMIQRLINRLRYDEKNKNIKIEKNRTLEFNLKSIKIVIHYLYNLAKIIKLYEIKSLKGHKVLEKYKKSILTHLRYFLNDLKNDVNKELEFKQQLKECLEIFSNLNEQYTFDEYEEIKMDIIDLFNNKNYNLLKIDLFQNLFERNALFNNDQIFIKKRNAEMNYYFYFFKIITKNSYYVYKKEEYKEKLIDSIKEFIDMPTFEKIFTEATDILSFTQKTILLKFIRTFYFIEYLEHINYLNKSSPLSNDEYKNLINNKEIKDINITQYLKISHKNKNFIKMNQTEKVKNRRKLEDINKLIILINIYSKEIEKFPDSIYNEDNKSIEKYIKEIIFAFHEISNYIYYNIDIINKLMPYYYKLFVNLISKKNIFIRILKKVKRNISININKLKSNKPEEINEEYKYLINPSFNIFNKKELFSLAIKNIYEIYSSTKINSDFSLQKYLEIYDNYNEANFPPFSLFEIKDYEYFYEQKNKDDIYNDLNEEKNNNKILIDIINENYLEQFKSVSMTSFLGILTGDSIDKKFDFGINFTELFEAFINSSEAGNMHQYRSLLCILNKMLFYDCEHIQHLLANMIYDKHFFKNINGELNYYIMQYITSAKKYELRQICSEITDITKLTIQFLQLLGEGFNILFHNNILEHITEKKRQALKKEIYFGKNEDISDSDESDNNIDFIINDDMIEKSIQYSIKQELNKTKKKPNIEPKFSIYKSMISNLKIIFYLMEYKNPVEGELAFDKLCILSSNIIDFLIEFIDTKKTLTNIVDMNIKNLFFGNKHITHIHHRLLNDVNHIPILSIFKIRIESKSEINIPISKYKLRKTMLAYMKIKYFQLLKSYIQFGTKKDFIKLLLEHKFGPIELFDEVIYYMRELINNLVDKDYDKYNFLLDIENVSTYKNKLKQLYMNEDDFRTSIELNLIFQICLVIMILEDIYDITMLNEYYNNDQINENKIKDEDDINEIKKEEEKNFFDNELDKDLENEENENEEINTESKKDEINDNMEDQDIVLNTNEDFLYKKKETNELSRNKINKYNNNITNNNTNTLGQLKTKLNYFSSINNTTENNKNNEDKNNIITLKENPKYINYKKEEEKYKFSYENVLKKYKRLLKKRKLEEIKEKLNSKKVKLTQKETNLRSIFSIAVYKFLFSLISKVQIRIDVSENVNILKKNYKNSCITKLSKQISKKIIDFKNKDKFLLRRSVQENLAKIEVTEIIDNINLKNKYSNFEDQEDKIAFFIKPYLAYHLSQGSKNNFLMNVDRSSAEMKYRSLLIFADYAIFEMMYNMKFVNKFNFVKKISKIKFHRLQIVNYILILIENILLMYHYYKNYTLEPTEYDVVNKNDLYKKFPDIIFIIVIKLIINIGCFILWFYCKFALEFYQNFLFSTDKTFIFRQNQEKKQNINHPTIVKYFQSEEGSVIETMKLINKDTKFFTKLKILIIDTIILNLDINIFLFSMILNILYLIHSHPLLLSIETLFIFGIFPSLLNIFKAFTAKASSLFSCLICTYLIVYIYNWLTIFYIRDTFVLEEVFEYQSGQYITEPFCHSSLQCLLIMINYGTRGGIDVPISSFKNSTKMFIWRFIYDMTFQIIVLMIMGNITFGLIVDSFGKLRDDTYNYENDKNNICFICQLSRDGCLLKNIDFDKHIKEEHNLWNYINFLIYLHLNNPNDFSRIEGIVWDKLPEKDFGWIPIDPEAGEKEDD